MMFFKFVKAKLKYAKAKSPKRLRIFFTMLF